MSPLHQTTPIEQFTEDNRLFGHLSYVFICLFYEPNPPFALDALIESGKLGLVLGRFKVLFAFQI